MQNLCCGIRYTHQWRITQDKTVPALYPEAEEFLTMPSVFATGYMVGLLEWACMLAIKPYLNWPQQQTVGIHIDVSHQAATPVGATVSVEVELIEMDGKRLVFAVQAHDGLDLIAKGTHQRFIIDSTAFNAKVQAKALSLQG